MNLKVTDGKGRFWMSEKDLVNNVVNLETLEY